MRINILNMDDDDRLEILWFTCYMFSCKHIVNYLCF